MDRQTATLAVVVIGVALCTIPLARCDDACAADCARWHRSEAACRSDASCNWLATMACANTCLRIVVLLRAARRMGRISCRRVHTASGATRRVRALRCSLLSPIECQLNANCVPSGSRCLPRCSDITYDEIPLTQFPLEVRLSSAELMDICHSASAGECTYNAETKLCVTTCAVRYGRCSSPQEVALCNADRRCRFDATTTRCVNQCTGFTDNATCVALRRRFNQSCSWNEALAGCDHDCSAVFPPGTAADACKAAFGCDYDTARATCNAACSRFTRQGRAPGPRLPAASAILGAGKSDLWPDARNIPCHVASGTGSLRSRSLAALLGPSCASTQRRLPEDIRGSTQRSLDDGSSVRGTLRNTICECQVIL